MRTGLFISVFLLTAFTSKSQHTVLVFKHGDTIILHNNPHHNYNMPNAMPVKPPPQVYIGNNGHGLDLHQSQIDGMGIAKPDSTFVSSMTTNPGNLSVLPPTKAERPKTMEDFPRRSPKKQADSTFSIPRPGQ